MHAPACCAASEPLGPAHGDVGGAVSGIWHGTQHHQGLLQDDAAIPVNGKEQLGVYGAQLLREIKLQMLRRELDPSGICAHAGWLSYKSVGMQCLVLCSYRLSCIESPTIFMGRSDQCCCRVLCACVPPVFLQPGKLVADTDARADVLSQLEVAFKAAPAQGDSKAANKAAK